MLEKIYKPIFFLLLLSFTNTSLPYNILKLKDFSFSIETTKETNEDTNENEEEEEFLKGNFEINLSANEIILQHIPSTNFYSGYKFSFAEDIIPPPPKSLT
jgi:hypothetical protein